MRAASATCDSIVLFGRSPEQGGAGMPDTHSFDPPDPMDRPICANCGWTMWVARIEPHQTGYDRHTLKCQRCDTEEIKIVKL